jgi:transposase InsO family protein
MYQAAVIAAQRGFLTCRVTHNSVCKAFEQLSIPVRHREKESAKRPRCRFEAQEANLIWHVDLHDHGPISHRQKLIAFMDDASRFVLGVRFLADKSSGQTAYALAEIINECNAVPYCIWSDNGTEFRGEFEALLTRLSIVHRRTEPYNPQQNGKIERWWQTADKFTAEALDQGVLYYNCYEPHRGLPMVQRSDSQCTPETPHEAYIRLPKCCSGQPGNWHVDGTLQPFV